MAPADHGFAAVDLETTGFRSATSDRIVEVAVARFGPEGRLLERFSTLVDPRRDVGPTHIHGIRARDVVGAPTFDQVAGEVAARLHGTVFVAHNAPFDYRFLRDEFGRAGVPMPEMPTLCTLTLARRLKLELPNRQLGTCCQHYGIHEGEAHTAEADAVSSGRLLFVFLGIARRQGLDSLADLGCKPLPPPTGSAWPPLPVGASCKRRGEASVPSKPSYVASLVGRLPAYGSGEEELVPYLALLDRVLEDRMITPREGDDLVAMAVEWGLSTEAAKAAHQTYLQQLVGIAIADGVVSESERSDLLETALLLGFDAPEVDRAVSEVREAPPAEAPVGVRPDLVGATVCFTGALLGEIDGEPITRERAIELAESAGLCVSRTVTKSTDVLVVADPYTQSGKAKTARRFGTRILAESVFWPAIGIQTE